MSPNNSFDKPNFNTWKTLKKTGYRGNKHAGSCNSILLIFIFLSLIPKTLLVFNSTKPTTSHSGPFLSLFNTATVCVVNNKYHRCMHKYNAVIRNQETSNYQVYRDVNN